MADTSQERITGRTFGTINQVDLLAIQVDDELPDYQDSLDAFRDVINRQIVLAAKQVDDSVSGFPRHWSELVESDIDLTVNIEILGNHIPAAIYGQKEIEAGIHTITAYWSALIESLVVVSRGAGKFAKVATYHVSADSCERGGA